VFSNIIYCKILVAVDDVRKDDNFGVDHVRKDRNLAIEDVRKDDNFAVDHVRKDVDFVVDDVLSDASTEHAQPDIPIEAVSVLSRTPEIILRPMDVNVSFS
jgi:hypothetical protein